MKIKSLLNQLTKESFIITPNKKKLHILCRCRDPIEEKAEIQFYNKILKSNCTFKRTYNWKKSYEFMDKFENIIFMNSTLGYEAIARKKKGAEAANALKSVLSQK